MRRRLITLLTASLSVASLSVALTAAASAADLPPAPVYTKAALAPAYNWTGCYVGVHAGGGLVEANFTNGTNGSNLGGAGALAGGQLGCNYQAGQLVFGIEGEGAWSGMTDRNAFINDSTSNVLTARNRSDADLSLRVGFAIDRALIYGKAGAALGSFEFKKNDNGLLSDGRSTLDGLLLGAGMEYGFAPSWTAKLEYNLVAFSDKDVLFNHDTGPFTETEGARKQLVKVGVNYRFGN
jgi:outer membrane immunogenic protein